MDISRGKIDFGSGQTGPLFRKIFFPTLVGMLFMSAQTIIDGIFVGRGVGADGIAGLFHKKYFKMKTQSKLFILLFAVTLQALFGCKAQAVAPSVYWDGDSAWYRAADATSPDKIDLIYLVSTDVVSATGDNGEKAYRARLTKEDRQAVGAEMAYVEANIGQGDFNYVAPYYHQFTFDAINLPADSFQLEYSKVAEEACEAFDYYMAHMNHGRRFALVGFSQGGMLVLDLLRHMTDKQYARMVAAYAMGYRISADDLKCRRIVPAADESSAGVTVSYNSVLDNSGIWPFVGGNAAAAINPVNWRTDSTTATFTYEGSRHKVHLDTATKQLIVATDRAGEYRRWNDNPVFRSAGVSLGCLHHWDLLFYTGFIHDNILKRAAGQK